MLYKISKKYLLLAALLILYIILFNASCSCKHEQPKGITAGIDTLIQKIEKQSSETRKVIAAKDSAIALLKKKDSLLQIKQQITNNKLQTLQAKYNEKINAVGTYSDSDISRFVSRYE